jgi:hypothetical protein
MNALPLLLLLPHLPTLKHPCRQTSLWLGQPVFQFSSCYVLLIPFVLLALPACLLFVSQVRYTCTRGSKDNVVLSVREFPTCNYVVVVSTPFLCKHPFFQPPVRPGVNLLEMNVTVGKQ